MTALLVTQDAIEVLVYPVPSTRVTQLAMEALIGTAPPNEPPVLDAIADQEHVAGSPITPFSATATDPDEDELTFSAESLPPGISLSSAGEFSGTPTTAGDYDPTVTVTDAGDEIDSQAFVWTITAAPEPSDSATGYASGLINGIDHGIRLRADLKLPVSGCSVCGGDHE